MLEQAQLPVSTEVLFIRAMRACNQQPQRVWEPPMIALLHEARFNAGSLKKEVVLYTPAHEDGTPKQKKIPLNEKSGITVYDIGMRLHVNATIWLNDLWKQLVESGAPDPGIVRWYVSGRKPLIPITFNEIGEVICELPPANVLQRHSSDRDPIGVIFHGKCGGLISSQQVSDTHRAFICDNGCPTLPIVPLTVTTYGELRAHLTQKK